VQLFVVTCSISLQASFSLHDLLIQYTHLSILPRILSISSMYWHQRATARRITTPRSRKLIAQTVEDLFEHVTVAIAHIRITLSGSGRIRDSCERTRRRCGEESLRYFWKETLRRVVIQLVTFSISYLPPRNSTCTRLAQMKPPSFKSH
jgi:hypothetical protein